MTLEKYHADQTAAMKERDLQEFVREAAERFGWLYYHTHRSDRSPAGFPDCVMVRPPRLVFAELKREGKKPTEEQQRWLHGLLACRVINPNDRYNSLPEVYIWRPSDLDTILEVLK